MGAEWDIIEVGKLADSISDTHSFSKGQLIFLNTSDIFEGKILHQNYSCVKDLPGQAKKSIKKGDILFSEIRPANGRYALVNVDADDYVVSTKLMVIRSKKGVSTKYLYHFLTSKQTTAWLQHLAESRSGTFPQITFDQVSSLELKLPPSNIQSSIVEILDSLDDKIELNRKMNETLEETARTIFKSWFVDFDPVVAKSEGRKPEGMGAETAKLFPDSFVDSEIGRIPKGWKAKPLTELIDVNPSRQIPKQQVAPYLDMGALSLRSARTDATILRPFASGSKFRNGDTLVARITPCLENGKTGFVDNLEDGQTGWGSTEFIVLCPKAPLPPSYGYFLARTDEFRSFAIANMTGTSGRQRVVVDSFSHFFLAEPPTDVAITFGNVATAILKQMKAYDAETSTLSALRDSLLPKLLSGELVIPTKGN